jgi:hypothetical protein
MLFVGLPLVYLINKLPVLFGTNYLHGIIKSLIPVVVLNFNHNVIKGKVFPAHAMEGYWSSRGTAPFIGRRWR